MRCCICCGKSISRGASLPLNTTRREAFLGNLCLLQYASYIPSKGYICYEHFHSDDIVKLENGEKRLKHSQVLPVALAEPIKNPRLKYRIQTMEAMKARSLEFEDFEEISFNKNGSLTLDDLVANKNVQDDEIYELNPETSLNRNLYTSFTNNAQKEVLFHNSKEKRMLLAQRLNEVREKRQKFEEKQFSRENFTHLNNDIEEIPKESSTTYRDLFKKEPRNVSQCFLCSRIILKGARLPQNSQYQQLWKQGLQMSSLPKNGMICFEHFRMDDLVFDGFGIPFSVRSGAAPYFKKIPPVNKLGSAPSTSKSTDPNCLGGESIEQPKDTGLPCTSADCAARISPSSLETSEPTMRFDPKKQSVSEIDPVTQIRYYEPHKEQSADVYCLSQVTQIGEKICLVENKLSQLVELVTDFITLQNSKNRELKLNQEKVLKNKIIDENLNKPEGSDEESLFNYSGKVQSKKSKNQRKRKYQETSNRGSSERVTNNKNSTTVNKTDKSIEESRSFLILNNIKIFYQLNKSKRNTRICKICFAVFNSRYEFMNHWPMHENSTEYLRCDICDTNILYLSKKAIEQHLVTKHQIKSNEMNLKYYDVQKTLTIRNKEILKAYIDKMFIDCGNVINLDSDSDEMPSTFLKEQTPIIKILTKVSRRKSPLRRSSSPSDHVRLLYHEDSMDIPITLSSKTLENPLYNEPQINERWEENKESDEKPAELSEENPMQILDEHFGTGGKFSPEEMAKLDSALNSAI